MKKNLCLFPLLVICLSSCGESVSKETKSTRDGARPSQIQMNYLENTDNSNTSPYNGNMSVGLPTPVRLSWDGSGDSFTVKLYKDEELTDLVVQYVTSNTFLDFYNDELDTDYYWTVNSETGKETSNVAHYKYHPTIAQPRHLNIEGVENFRDLGGWGTYDSTTNKYKTYIKQGLIYRSGRFNEDKANPVKVTIKNNGLYELNNHLKIKTEIDLRRSSNNEIGSLTNSVLGQNVNYFNLPMYYGGNNVLTYKGTISGDTYQYDNPKAIKQFFDILAEEKNYPINFHCSIGKDRTGCMAYLIEALMGFDKDLMYRDYMFTNFSDAGMCKLQVDVINRYGATIDSYTGETTQEKTYKYLNEVVGVSSENLNNIKQILSPEVE